MDDIKSQVRQLDRRQLAELRSYINGLAATDAAPETGRSGLLLPVFEESCRRFGLGYVSPAIRQRLTGQEEALTGFLSAACPRAEAVTRRAILATAIDLLYRDLLANGRMVNPRNLAYGLDRLPALLDKSFPGYAACGLLGYIVRRAA